MAPGARRTGETRDRILDVAERLVQESGFNGFSYGDVASELGITRASLHYHFAGKADLAEALVSRYASRFAEALERIDAEAGDAPAKLDAYASLYAEVLRGRRMCLCGMLAAEYETLAGRVRSAVVRFFDDNQSWLARVLEQGRREGALRFDGAADGVAQTLLSGLEGAMLVARPYGDPVRFEAAARLLFAGLAGAAREPLA